MAVTATCRLQTGLHAVAPLVGTPMSVGLPLFDAQTLVTEAALSIVCRQHMLMVMHHP